MTGFWPARAPNSSTASSRILTFWIASPIPMLREIRSIRGTAMMLSMPNSFWIFGTTSSLYRVLRRGTYPSGVGRTGPDGAAGAAFPLPPFVSLFLAMVFAFNLKTLASRLPEGGAAVLAYPHAAPIFEATPPHPGRLAALGADHLQVGDLDWRLTLEDAALDALVRVRPRVPLDHVHALDDGLALAGEDAQDPAAGAPVLACRDEHLVVLLDVHLCLHLIRHLR